jgi:hypothetical protein
MQTSLVRRNSGLRSPQSFEPVRLGVFLKRLSSGYHSEALKTGCAQTNTLQLVDNAVGPGESQRMYPLHVDHTRELRIATAALALGSTPQ